VPVPLLPVHVTTLRVNTEVPPAHIVVGVATTVALENPVLLAAKPFPGTIAIKNIHAAAISLKPFLLFFNAVTNES
jgi:hypothetical protein